MRIFLLAMLLGVCALADSSASFRLGLNYSEPFVGNAAQMATDGSGALYVFSPSTLGTSPAFAVVTKVSADGTTIIWQNRINDPVEAFAVDPNGGVYVTLLDGGQLFAGKVNPGPQGFVWRTSVAAQFGNSSTPSLTADTAGRVYLLGGNDPGSLNYKVVRLSADGSAVDYVANFLGVPTSIAVDANGVATVAGLGFVTRFGPDGSAVFYTKLSALGAGTLALDASGNAVLFDSSSGSLQRLNAAGTVVSATTVVNWTSGLSFLGLDKAGNAYVGGFNSGYYPVTNTIAPCGSALISVISPDGSTLQTFYVPGLGGLGQFLLALSPNGNLFVAGPASAGYAPTRSGPFARPGLNDSMILVNLAQNTNASTLALACVVSAATFQISPIAPGEIVTLFGSGLGPATGVTTQASLQSPFPVEAGNVRVTFDGDAAPLLWVQEAQVNAIVPWSVQAGKQTRVCVINNGEQTNCLNWPVAQTAPGVFTVDGEHAAALNEDGTINSAANPAHSNSTVSVFATGLGPIVPAQGDGTLVNLPLPLNVIPLAAVQEALTDTLIPIYLSLPFTYAGPAPYLVAGTSQINFNVGNISEGITELQTLSLDNEKGAQSNAFAIYVTPQ